MKKHISSPRSFLTLVCLLLSLPGLAQMPLSKAEPSIQLKIESAEGTNGSAVAYNPEDRMYYAVIAGNAVFPVETFNVKGEQQCSYEAGQDFRGLWWNSVAHRLEGNLYGSGAAWLRLNDGCATGAADMIAEGFEVPSDQSVAFFDAGKKKVCIYYDGEIWFYKPAGFKRSPKSLRLQLSRSSDFYNTTTGFYTGAVGYEFGVVDFEEKKVELFNRKGALTATVMLPADAVVNDMFWMSYANNQLWLYNEDTRSWQGYRILK